MSIAFDETALDCAFDVKGRSLWVDARRRLIANKAAVAAMAVLATIAVAAIFAPLLSPYAYDTIDYSVISCAPDWWPGTEHCRDGAAHWLGTDAVGRDLFIRILYGARVSLSVGVAATFVSLVIGVGYGAIAGFALQRRPKNVMSTPREKC